MYRLVFATTIAFQWLGPLSAQTTPTPLDSIVTTRHRLTIGARALGYTARAGQLPIRDNDTGEPLAWMFFTSYTLDQPAGRPSRPLLFYWNGGPGSSAAQVHLLGLGPRIVRMPDDFAAGEPLSGGTMMDNEATWLLDADLVFVDPVGTGYSRATKREYADSFFSVRPDAEAMAEFIRLYRIRFGALEAPLYIGGESYGTTRAAHVADVLVRKRVPLAGAVLAALAVPTEARPAEVVTAVELPSYTAIAHHWRRLPPALQADRARALDEAERWASNEYLRALRRRDSLTSAERAAVIEQLARFSGLDRSLIDPKSLAIDQFVFVYQLVRDRGLLVGLYDGRRGAPWSGPMPTEPDPLIDPALVPQLPYMNGTAPLLIRYFREQLGYRNDLAYQGPFGGTYPTTDQPRGDWSAYRWIKNDPTRAAEMVGPAPGTVSPLRRALDANPDLRILTQCGYHDLICHYYENVWAVEQLPPALRARFTVRSYDGGHEAYLSKAARVAMARDFGRFVRGEGAGGRR